MATKRSTVALDDDQLAELRAAFNSIDEDNNGFISVKELDAALKCVGLNLPGYEVRELVAKYDSRDCDGKLDMEEFKNLYANEKAKRDIGHTFKKAVSTRQGVATMGGTSYASSEGTTHTVKAGEQKAFAEWINRHLMDDPDCKGLLPLDNDGIELFKKMADGILLCKLINHSVPDTIDERTINKTNMSLYRRHENLTLAVNSAGSIGCTTVNIGPEDLAAGRPHLVLGLLWQIIRIGLLSDINLAHHPGLVNLLLDGETIEDLIRLSPEQILLRWVNYHLARAGTDRQISNFGDDIKDSEAYIYLLKQIAPPDRNVTMSALTVPDLHQRAECMLQEAEKLECRSFVGPADVVSGNQKLNLAFVANLFNNFPALDTPQVEVEDMVKEESREEKTYRNWMNSLGVSPYVHHLFSDLYDGLVIFQLYDFIQPGLVDWNKVKRKFNKMRARFEKIENCNYAVELGPKVELVKVKLVGIGGQDIFDGSPVLTLGLVWQLMRAYTLAILSKITENNKPIQDSEIIAWVNSKLKKEDRISGFNDSKLKDGVIVGRVIDSIKVGIVNWDNISADAHSDKELLTNARYVLGLARKIGAGVYALPEDIVEVKPKMLLTIFACLMVRDLSARNITKGTDANSH
ncbi:plastin-1-like [Babylonia areolata]|uniref:plastin-1-like n=1 Tax=Babylonia areolata TaxID=304850 RepID=UPI003FCFD682